jgi:L-fucono-1,5-lactonase
MKIDAHQHFWRYDAARDRWITEEMRAIRRDFLPGDLEAVVEANGFDGCVAVQADQSHAETTFLLDLAHRHPFIKGVVGWVDLRAEPRELARTLASLAADAKFRGVRHVAQAEPDDFLTRDDVVRGIACVGRAGLTYDILLHARQLPAAIALASRLPDQPFVLDHLGKPPIARAEIEPWARSIRELARRPNVWCKLSGLVTEAVWASWRPEHLRPYLDVALDAFGAGRVMFGSDWPVCLVAAAYDHVVASVEELTTTLSDPEREALFGGTAVRFYGLR